MIQHFDSQFEHLEDVEVQTPEKEDIIKAILSLDERLNNAKDGNEAVQVVREYFELSDQLQTAFSLINVRHTIDTRDEHYKELNDLIDEISPEINEASNRFDQDFYNSPFRKELEEAFGSLYFDMVALSMKTFKPEIVPDLVEENKLVSEYVNLVSSGMIEFRGEKYSLPQMGKFLKSMDRETRKEASEAYWGFFAENNEKIGDIYSRMVQVRTKIAKELGYKNFVQLAYDRMGRLDWTPEDAKVYREKILKYIVPLSEKIFADQKERLGYQDTTAYYDYSIFYKSGNPTPKGTPEELVFAARKMYEELSPVASKYFNFMVDHHCMDIVAKPGKAGGGYMTYIPGLKTSFIFSNFNGTSGDVDVLTHEFGHSLQGFLGGDNIPAYRNPGMECCEMHSMSMEYLTYPWMNLFFKEDTEKYLYQHLADAITFIPYGCIVDAFQAYVYENPDLTHKERKAYFRELEKTYLPHKNYAGNEFLESGGFFMKQSHIFELPFYYLDYTIAQVVSLEFFSMSEKDHQGTFEKYLDFCSLAGTLPFRALLKKANIKNPMDGDTLKEVAEETMAYLNTFDLSKIDQ